MANRLSLHRYGLLRTICAEVLMVSVLSMAFPSVGFAVSTFNPTLLVNTEAFTVIDDSNATANVYIKFGDTLAKTLTYNRTTSRFEFSAPLYVTGNLAATGTTSGATLHAENLLNSSGALSIRGNSSFQGSLTFGDAVGDAVTNNAGTWTFANDTNFALSGGVNGLSFDTNTFSVDATSHRIGIGTTTPKTTLDVAGTISGSALTMNGGITFGNAAAVTLPGVVNAINFNGNSLSIDALNHRVAMGKTTPTTKLDVVGTISGSLVTASNISTQGSLVYYNGTSLAGTAQAGTGKILVGQDSNAPIFKSPTASLVWYLDGTIAVGTSEGAIITMPTGFTASSVTLRATGAPTGTALIVDIKKAGATIFSTKPQINASSTTGGGSAVFSTTDLPAGSELSVDVNQIGGTFAGSGLTILLNGTRKY